MEIKFKDTIKKVDFIGHYSYMQIANLLLRLIYQSNITPNKVTLFSIIIGITSGIAFAFKFTFVGLFLFTFAYILDCLDGQLARFNNSHSKFGLFFDNTRYRIAETAVLVGLSYSYIRNSLLIGLNLIYWYANDIIYHQKRQNRITY